MTRHGTVRAGGQMMLRTRAGTMPEAWFGCPVTSVDVVDGRTIYTVVHQLDVYEVTTGQDGLQWHIAGHRPRVLEVIEGAIFGRLLRVAEVQS